MGSARLCRLDADHSVVECRCVPLEPHPQGRQGIGDFSADGAGGADWYKRATRAHANCVENLPVYGAIVLAAHSAQLDDPLLDTLACALLIARVIQSLVHISFVQTNRVVSVRFSFFIVQFICMAWMAIHVANAVANAA
jgi:uncharacterized MAPEG superfamily protein